MKKLALLLFLMQITYVHAGDYEPWVTDEFFFHNPGEKRTYSITPDRLSRPEIVLYDTSCALPSNLFEVLPNGKPVNQFSWQISVEVIRNKKVIEKKILKPRATWVSETNAKCLKSISFEALKSISRELFPKQVAIVITVHKIDPRFSKPMHGLTFGIRSSPVP